MRVTDEYLLMKARRDDGIGDIARELIAARKVVEAARDHGRWCSIKLSCRLCAALREYDAGESEAQPEPADKHYFGRYSRLMEAVLAALDKEAGR